MEEINHKEYLVESFKKSEILQLLEAKIVAIQNGHFEMKIPKKKFMLRPAGMFNGSIIATLVDISSGYAAASAKPTGSYLTTAELKINYLSPAIGSELKAKARVLKNGKILSVIGSDIYVIDGHQEKHVATALVTIMQLLNKENITQVD